MDGPEQDTELLRALVEQSGDQPTRIAKKIGVHPSTINKPYGGQATSRLSRSTIAKLRAAYPDFRGWTDVPQDPISAPETLSIPMLELGYGMGGTFLDEREAGDQVEDFPASFIRKFTKTPANLLAWADGIGDSMYPTIGDRDLLLIDRSVDSIAMNDQIWALASGEIGMVKRVRMTNGQVHLMSDNPNVSDYVAGEDELSVIGRVVAVVRRI